MSNSNPSSLDNSTIELQKPIVTTSSPNNAKPYVRRCFYLIEDVKPTKTGFYEVITTKGRVVTVHFKNFLGNNIWEIDIDGHELDEGVIAWCQNIA